jgi:hypothetical protein
MNQNEGESKQQLFLMVWNENRSQTGRPLICSTI